MEIQVNIDLKKLWKGSIEHEWIDSSLLSITKNLEDPSKSSREWVSRLQNVVSALNNERTRLIEMKPVDAIKQTLVKQRFSQPVKDYKEKLLDVGTKVRYLYEPGELEGQQYGGERRKRSTDTTWSVDVYIIKNR